MVPSVLSVPIEPMLTALVSVLSVPMLETLTTVASEPPPAVGGIVLILEAEGNTFALQVDDLIGQQQVVIKSLEENFQSIEGIAGGTILGDGNVALIVDVQGLKTATATHKSAA